MIELKIATVLVVVYFLLLMASFTVYAVTGSVFFLYSSVWGFSGVLVSLYYYFKYKRGVDRERY